MQNKHIYTSQYTFARRLIIPPQRISRPLKPNRQQAKHHDSHYHKKRVVWVLITSPALNKPTWFQLPRDLQHAIAVMNQQENIETYLIGALINFPLTKYQGKKTKIRTGQITKLKHKARTHNTGRITRSQFYQFSDPNFNYQQAYNYLKHDYSWINRFHIKHNLKKLHKQFKVNINDKNPKL